MNEKREIFLNFLTYFKFDKIKTSTKLKLKNDTSTTQWRELGIKLCRSE